MSRKEYGISPEDEEAAITALQRDMLRRFQENGLVDLFIKTAIKAAPHYEKVKVTISKPTGNMRDLQTVALVCKKKDLIRRLSAYEITLPDGQKGFRIRLGHDKENSDNAAAYVPNGLFKRFNGHYGKKGSLVTAERILSVGIRHWNFGHMFSGGHGDITPPSFGSRVIRTATGNPTPRETPSDIVFPQNGKRARTA
jgi:hypothetical protein